MKRLLLTIIIMAIFIPMLSGQAAIDNIIKGKLDVYNSILPYEKVYMQCDRPFYKPGDDIWMALWITDGVTNKPSAVSEIINIELIDPKGTTVTAHRILTKGGRAQCDFTLDSLAMGGIYKIKAYTSWMENFPKDIFFVKEIQVQEVSLPVARMKLDFERKAYGEGDTVKVKLLMQDSDNTLLADYPYGYNVSINGEKYLESFGTTDSRGVAHIIFTLPLGLKVDDGLITVRADVKGNIVSIARSVPIVLDNIDLQFFPEGGDLVAGVMNNCAFKAVNEYGKPADVEGVVFNSRHKEVVRFRSYHHGMGSFRFVPEPGERYYALLDKPQGIMKLYPLPVSARTGFLMELPSPLMFTRPVKAEKAHVRIVSPENTTVTLIAQLQGKIYYNTTISVIKGENRVFVPLSGIPCGVLQITLFTGNTEVCERLVFVNKDKQMKVSLTADKDSYQPRDKVKLKIRTTDMKGNPVSAGVALAVVDDKLISLADERSDNILSYLLLSSEVKGKIEEPSFYFDESESRADTALDYLLLTQGWRRFTWEEVVETPSHDLAGQITHKPEKMILCGTVSSKSRSEIARTRLYIKETGQKATPDRNGYYEFRGLDLSTPVTLVAITGNNDTIERVISDYSSADTYKRLYYQSLGDDVASGVVRDKSTGVAIPGATIVVKGTATGTVTDLEGRFFIKVSKKDVLVISVVGYRSLEQSVEKAQNCTIELERDYIQLNEVLVVTQALQIKRSIVGSAVAVQNTRKPVRLNAEQDNTAKQRADKTLIPAVENGTAHNRGEAVTTGDQIIYLDNDIEEEVEDEQIFVVVEEMPQFPGGDNGVLEWISANLRYPEIARENYIQGRVIVRFIVNREGLVVDPVIIRGIDPTLDKEALRVVSMMPRWKPARQMGRPVDASYIIPINFRINDDNVSRGYVTPDRYQEPQRPQYYRARQFYVPVYDASEEVFMRNDFRKTIYWNPDITTDSNGNASVEFCTSDALTTFRATAEGIGSNGAPGRSEHTFYSSKPLSVEALIPEKVSFGDTLFIPITVTNRAEREAKCILSVEYPLFLQPLGETPSEVTIQAEGGLTLFAGFVVLNSSGSGLLKIKVGNETDEDVISSSITSVPYGYKQRVSYMVTGLHSLFEVPVKDALPGSVRAEAVVYPGVQSSLSSSLMSMLREPHGCFEQASAITYPDIMVLRYLNETGIADNESKTEALNYITRGYKLLASYEAAGGGFEWFGKSPGHEGLTAMGLMLFNDMKSVSDIVDDGMYNRTLFWLLGRRDRNGGFMVEKGKYGFSNNAYLLNNAYIVYALSETGSHEIYREFEKAYNDNINRGDAYCMALLANSAFNLNDTVRAEALINHLRVQADEYGIAALKAETSITGSRGKSLSVETASLVALALMKQQDPDEKLLLSCMSFILSSRSYGSFGTTQANILALKAMTAFYRLYPDLLSGGTVEVKVNGTSLPHRTYEPQMSEPLMIENLHDIMKSGSNTVDVIFSGTVLPPDFRLNLEYFTATPQAGFQSPVSVMTEMKQLSARRGESIRMTLHLKNEEERTQSMAVASVALPAGFAFQPWQLKELQEKSRFDYYEISGNTLFIYYRSLAPGDEYIIDLDIKAMIPGIYHSFSSEGYLYYMPEAKSYGKPVTLEVLKD